MEWLDLLTSSLFCTEASVWALSSEDTVDQGIPVAQVNTTSTGVWKISTDDVEEELEDEDTLLGAEDFVRPAQAGTTLYFSFLFSVQMIITSKPKQERKKTVR